MPKHRNDNSRSLSALNEVGLNISIDGMGTSVSQEFERTLPKGTVVELHSGIWTTSKRRYIKKNCAR